MLIAASVIITVALLLGGQYAWHKLYLERPLTAQLQTLGVRSCTISYTGPKDVVTLSMGKVSDFQSTYQQIEQTLDTTLGKGSYDLEITNQANRELSGFLVQVQPVLFEGIQTGKYTWMVNLIDGKARSAGLESKVQIDENSVYLQIFGKGGTAYRIIPREQSDTRNLAFSN